MWPVKAIFYGLPYVPLWVGSITRCFRERSLCSSWGGHCRLDSREWWKSSLLWTLCTIICDTLISFLWDNLFFQQEHVYNSQCLFCHTNIAKCHTLLTEDYCLTTSSSPHPGRFLCSGFLECLHDWHPKNSCRGDYHPGGGGMDISGTAHSDL